MTPAPVSDPRALIRYAIAGVALTVLFLWTAYLVRGPLMLIYVSALLATGLAPLVAVVERQRLIPRPSSAALGGDPDHLSCCSSACSWLLRCLVTGPLVAQARELWTALPDMVQRGQQWLIERGLLTRELSLGEALEKHR